MKRFLTFLMLGFTIGSFGMQQPSVEEPDDSVEPLVQSFYQKYESVDRIVRSIQHETAFHVRQAKKEICEIREQLNTIEQLVTKNRPSAENLYAIARWLRVEELQKFEAIESGYAVLVLRSLINTRIMNLRTDINRCEQIANNYDEHVEEPQRDTGELPVVHAPVMSSSGEVQQKRSEDSQVTARSVPVSDSTVAMISAGVGLVAVLGGYMFFHRGGVRPSILVPVVRNVVSVVPVVTSTVPTAVRSDRLWRAASGVAVALGSGIWGARHSVAEVARDMFDSANILSWFQMFLGQ